MDKLNKELKQNDNKRSVFSTREEQSKFLALVMEHGDDWAKVAEKAGLKNKKEAILEFLRVPLTPQNQDLCLQDYTHEEKEKEGAVKVFSEADELVLQCQLLRDFVAEGNNSEEQKATKVAPKKREEKKKKKLAQMITKQELELMKEELQEFRKLDQAVTKAR